MADEQDEDDEFVRRFGPVVIDWPRSIGYFGGVAAALAFDLIAPELALFVAAVPLVKLLKREHATRAETALAAVIEGAAKPLGGDAQATVRPTWLADQQQRGTRDARPGSMQDEHREEQHDPSAPDAEQMKQAAESTLERMWRFACDHPVLSIAGVAGVGLVGGIELAGGVLIGAGVAAALRGAGRQDPEQAARTVRMRARSLLSRAPREVRERARAVVAAARGTTEPNGHAAPSERDVEAETPGTRH